MTEVEGQDVMRSDDAATTEAEKGVAKRRGPVAVRARVHGRRKPTVKRKQRIGESQAADTAEDVIDIASRMPANGGTKFNGAPENDEDERYWEVDPDVIHNIDFSQRKLNNLPDIPQTVTINGVLYDTCWKRFRLGAEIDRENLLLCRDEYWFICPPTYLPDKVKIVARHVTELSMDAVTVRDLVVMIRDRRISRKFKEENDRRTEEISQLGSRDFKSEIDEHDKRNIVLTDNVLRSTRIEGRGGRVALTDVEDALREAEERAQQQIRGKS